MLIPQPLIVASPKLLLRLPAARSSLDELAPGTKFHPVLPDPAVKDPASIKRVVLCSGKFYYELEKAKPKDVDVAFIRLEELSPYPAAELRAALAPYKNASEFIWCQEEPENMGAWPFVQPRSLKMLLFALFAHFPHRLFFQNKLTVKYVGRPALAAPAVGYSESHK